MQRHLSVVQLAPLQHGAVIAYDLSPMGIPEHLLTFEINPLRRSHITPLKGRVMCVIVIAMGRTSQSCFVTVCDLVI